MSDDLRVPLQPAFPDDMDPRLRAALTDAFVRVTQQVNRLSQRSITVTTDHVASEDIVLADATAGTVTVTLVPASDWTDKTVRVKKLNSNANPINIIVSGGGTIDESATASIATQYDVLQLMSDGAAWYIV